MQSIGYYVTPSAAREGGCQRLAMDLVRRVEAGHRTIPDEAGLHVLSGALGIVIPTGFRIVTDEGPDFLVHHVWPIVPFGQRPAYLGVYRGSHPGFDAPAGARREERETLGGAAAWFEWEDDGTIRRETIVERSSGLLHVFMGAPDRASLERLVAVADTLTFSATPRPLAPCEPRTPRPYVAPAGVLELPEVEALARATSVSWFERTFRQERLEATEAFRALLDHPSRREAFEYLATSGSGAGRVYGLAGLYFSDREAFAEHVCTMPWDESVDVLELSRRALRSEERGPLDIRVERLARRAQPASDHPRHQLSVVDAIERGPRGSEEFMRR